MELPEGLEPQAGALNGLFPPLGDKVPTRTLLHVLNVACYHCALSDQRHGSTSWLGVGQLCVTPTNQAVGYQLAATSSLVLALQTVPLSIGPRVRR
jgi:hypothetical protein